MSSSAISARSRTRPGCFCLLSVCASLTRDPAFHQCQCTHTAVTCAVALVQRIISNAQLPSAGAGSLLVAVVRFLAVGSSHVRWNSMSRKGGNSLVHHCLQIPRYLRRCAQSV